MSSYLKEETLLFPPPQNSFKLNLENASSTFPPSFLPSVASSSFLMLASDAGWKAFSNYKLNFIKEVVEASTAEHKCPPASIFYIHTHCGILWKIWAITKPKQNESFLVFFS